MVVITEPSTKRVMSARARTSSYSRILQGENSTTAEEEPHIDEDTDKKLRSSKAERISTKIHAFLWVTCASLLLYYLEFFRVLLTDDRVNRRFLNVGLVTFGINVCITIYLAIWLPYIKKIDLEWSVYCPRMIPTATFFGVISILCFLIGLWPIWGLLTPGILFIVLVGALMSAHFLPAI